MGLPEARLKGKVQVGVKERFHRALVGKVPQYLPMILIEVLHVLDLLPIRDSAMLDLLEVRPFDLKQELILQSLA